jgi:hypothetical protein
MAKAKGGKDKAMKDKSSKLGTGNKDPKKKKKTDNTYS